MRGRVRSAPQKTQWREREDPKTGKLYYYNKSTMIAQWKRPIGVDIASSRSRSASRSRLQPPKRKPPAPPRGAKKSETGRRTKENQFARAFSDDPRRKQILRGRESPRELLRRHSDHGRHREVKQQRDITPPGGVVCHYERSDSLSRESPESTTEQEDETFSHAAGRSQARGSMAIATIDEEMQRLRRERDYLRKELKLQTQAHSIELRTAEEESRQRYLKLERELQMQHDIEMKGTIQELESHIDKQEEQHARRYAKMVYEQKKELERLEESLREEHEEELAELGKKLSISIEPMKDNEKKRTIDKIMEMKESNDNLIRSEQDLQEKNSMLVRKIDFLERIHRDAEEKHKKSLENNAIQFFKQEETYQKIIFQMSSEVKALRKALNIL